MLRRRKYKVSMVVSKYIEVDYVLEFSGKTIVEKFLWNHLQEQVHNRWFSMLAYKPIIHVLPCGYIVFIFQSKEGTQNISKGLWFQGQGYLNLKSQNIYFHAKDEVVTIMLIWDNLSNLSMALWSMKGIYSIGNKVERQ